MNAIGAQMTLDFASLRGVLGRQVVIAVAVGVFVGIVGGSMAASIAACAFLVPFSLVFTMLSYDETQGWQAFRLAMPLSRRGVVTGRYASLAWVCLLGIACGLAAFALIFAIASAASSLQTGVIPTPDELIAGLASMGGGSMADFAWAMVALCAISLSLAVVMLALTLPFVLRMGFTKAVRVIPVAMMVLILCAMLSFGSVDSALIESIFCTILSPGGTLMMLVVAIALYALSCVVAIRLYEAREF